MAPFDTPNTSSHWRSLVTVALTCINSTAGNFHQNDTVCSGQLSLLSSAGRETSSSLPTVSCGRKPSVDNWGNGMSASCTAGPVVVRGNEWPHSALRCQ